MYLKVAQKKVEICTFVIMVEMSKWTSLNRWRGVRQVAPLYNVKNPVSIGGLLTNYEVLKGRSLSNLLPVGGPIDASIILEWTKLVWTPALGVYL